MEQVIASVLASGSVPLNRCKVFVVGPGRHGKTSLINSLMRRPFQEDCASTAGAVQEAVSCKTDYLAGHQEQSGKIWTAREAPKRELEDILRHVALAQVQNPPLPPPPFSASGSHTTQTSIEDGFNGAAYKIASLASAVKSFLQPTSAAASVLPIERIDYDKNLVFESVDGYMHTDTDLALMLIDCGGQSVFNLIHHLVFRRQAVYIAVFDMELMISLSTRESCLKSLRSWLNSITVHTLNSSTMQTASVAVVGTRGDKVVEKAALRIISNLLQEQFGHSSVWSNLIANDNADLNFFPVNNRLGWEDQGVIHLTSALEQRMLNKQRCPFVTAAYPLMWIKCLDAMQALKKDVIPLTEFRSLAVEIGVKDYHVQEDMLRYFHDSGHCLWIEHDCLRDWVVVDAFSFLVTPVAAVIGKLKPKDQQMALHEREIHRTCRALYTVEWDEYMDEGILSHRLLRFILSEMLGADQGKVDAVCVLMKRYGFIADQSFAHSPDSPPIQLPSHSTTTTAAAAAATATTTTTTTATTAPYQAVKYCVPAMLPDLPLPLLESSAVDGGYRTGHSSGYSSTGEWLDNAYSSCLLSFSVSDTWNTHTKMTAAHLMRYGFLPVGLFERLLGKVLGVCSSGSTHNKAILRRRQSQFWLGDQRFRLSVVEHLQGIRLDIEGRNAIAIHAVVMDQLDLAISGCMGCLKYTSLVAALDAFGRPVALESSAVFLVVSKLNELCLSSTKIDVGEEQCPRLLDHQALKAGYSAWLVATSVSAFDVFLSYRWGEVDSKIVSDVHKHLTGRHSIGSDFRSIRVFLDVKVIPWGENFQEFYAQCLLRSASFAPIVSASACSRLASGGTDWGTVCDNWLVELVLAVESYYGRGCVQCIYPLLLGVYEEVNKVHGSLFATFLNPSTNSQKTVSGSGVKGGGGGSVSGGGGGGGGGGGSGSLSDSGGGGGGMFACCYSTNAIVPPLPPPSPQPISASTVSPLPSVVPTATLKFAKQMLQKYAPSVYVKMSAELRNETLTVRAVIERVLAFNVLDGKAIVMPGPLVAAVVSKLVPIIKSSSVITTTTANAAVADSASEVVELSPEAARLACAYEIITSPGYAVNYQELQQLLREAGVMCASDLAYASDALKHSIMGVLKDVPRSKFQAMMT